jgi:hypothetical protein
MHYYRVTFANGVSVEVKAHCKADAKDNAWAEVYDTDTMASRVLYVEKIA